MRELYINKVQAWVKGVLPLCLFTFLPVLVACDHIAEGDELIYVPQEPAQRVVLLEDFTGQRCVNCPKGAEVIEQLQQTYGDNIVAVGIHGGPLGFKGNATTLGLATDLGDEYYNHWNLEYQPVGLVNRQGAVNYTDWTKSVRDELAKTSPVALDATATEHAGTVSIGVTAEGKDGTIVGKLQVWLTEDNITDGQRMPDGVWNKEYVHNHVFRDAVNAAWGTDFSIKEGEQKELTFTYTIAEDKDWQPANMHVVAFVYNDKGVEQVTTAKLNSELK